jgi:preprotein translocase subunit SecD
MKSTGRLVMSLVFVGILVVASISTYLVATFRPLLGLDLVGGVSVILSGPAGTDPGVRERALDRIRDRVDALGVAEPDITLIGSNLIQVQLPGLGEQGHVVEQGELFCAVSASGQDLGCFVTREKADAKAKAASVQRVLQLIGTTARLEERQVLALIPPSDAAYKDTALTPTDPNTGAFQSDGTEVVTFEDTNGDGTFTDGTDVKYRLGPPEVTGADLTKATAQFVSSSSNPSSNVQPGWRVVFNLNKEGSSKFGDVTTRLVSLPAPTNQLAIVLDGKVQSAPTVQGAITGGQGEITGGFSESEAKNLAVVLNSGALPVELQRQEVRTVSPLLGKESLREGVIAGLVGLVALMAYLAFYYRLLGVVTWVGMAIWGVLAIALVSAMGRALGYSLTLAGVAGLIVSLGITADSYIVFYERLKDEVRHGKSLRAAVQPAFKRSWKTIVAADVVTIIAAAVLYLLAIGSVRGFALTLGLCTALDLFVVWFYKRPAVFLISRSPLLTSLRGMGLRSSVAADPLPVAGAQQ